jgi:hypothetical protein
VRPVREQLEHDRVIRLLQAKYKRKFEVAINPGQEQTTPVTVGTTGWYPDLVLQSAEKHRRLQGVVEVETSESVNNLEAMSQWATFARLRVPFHLYVPASSIDSARRLCTDLQIAADEIWAYHSMGDQLRFTLVQRASPAAEPRPRETKTRETKPRPTPSASSKSPRAPVRAMKKKSESARPGAKREVKRVGPPARKRR